MEDKPSDLKGKPSLGPTTEHRMRLYALASAAASVSALALAQSAEATIIITNKNIPIHAETPVMLDMNADGIADFQFYLRSYPFHNTSDNYLYVHRLTAGGAVIGQVSPFQRWSAARRLDQAVHSFVPTAFSIGSKSRTYAQRCATAPRKRATPLGRHSVENGLGDIPTGLWE